MPSRSALALSAALLAGCGGGGSATPDSLPPTPAPSPSATPTPEPTPEPTPAAHCPRPLPPPISRVKVRVLYKNREYWTLDATPLVGPDPVYCKKIGYTDGRVFCTVRPEGDPERSDCEAYAVGFAEDTGRPGPTWTRGGQLCTGPDSLCQNTPDNQFQLWIFRGAVYTACVENGTCGSVDAEKDL